MKKMPLCGSIKIKLNKDHKIINTDTCGQIREVLSGGEQPGLDLALAIDIKPTRSHFHTKFDEIYFVLDGSLTLEIYDPSDQSRQEYELHENELCVVTKGLHHRVIKASEENRLCVISLPRWISDDEQLSDVF